MFTIFLTPSLSNISTHGLLAAMKRAREVHGHLPIKLGCGNLRKIAHEASSGIVNQNVDPTKALIDLHKGLFDRIRIDQVADKRHERRGSFSGGNLGA